MKIEYKISLAILLAGGLGVGGMIIYKKFFHNSLNKKNNYSQKGEEKIILPNISDDKIYQNLPLIKSYLSDLKIAIKNSNGILPLSDKELDSKALLAQKIVFKNREFIKDNIINGKNCS